MNSGGLAGRLENSFIGDFMRPSLVNNTFLKINVLEIAYP
jgi:hypothetical protein